MIVFLDQTNVANKLEDCVLMSLPKKQDKSHFMPVSQIYVARENSLLYDNFGIANTDDAALAISIQEKGILEPLVITADNILLSGHRRLASAKVLGLEQVPVRHVDVNFEALDRNERVELLRLYNQQREKSTGEKVREKLIDINPAKARSELIKQRSQIRNNQFHNPTNMQMGKCRQRASITTLQFLEKVKQVIEENRPYWPLTVRRVHYLLLNDPPLRHDKKPTSKYVNDKYSYKALTNLVIRARLTFEVPQESIEDSTRPVQEGGGFSNLQEFMAQEVGRFLFGYSRNLMQGQTYHIEIMLEKNALRTVIESVAREYCIPCTTGRGYSSLSPRYELAQRYFNSGKSTLVLLMLTDFDPDGDEIAESFARSLRDDFNITNIRPIKVGLTAQDVADNQFPSDMDAKISSPHYKKFIQKHGGTKVVELDAAPVNFLQSKLRQAIESVIDVNEFNTQIELEQQDAAQIFAYRQVGIEAIQGALAN